ncbi:PAS domain-containing protein [uncultured Cytophaga sp.]|mgnify:CR=1 FL=1|uniref:PAS domain-containing protein n=1 Tax=uncultured Cytophaga sp. TaxID=160238 RepID=UPI0026309AC3|nr:PAS domain-containing protein [uncultured Cytophaga sp.]
MTGELHNQKGKASTLDNLIEGFQLIGFDWRYLYVNDSVVKHSKFKKEELLGYTMMEKYPGIEKTPLFDLLKICMKERCAEFFENEFTYQDNSKGWFELRIQPVPEGLFILSIDITERKKAQEKKLEYIQGLEEMLFMTSHQVRQPVTQMLGMTSLIDRKECTQEDLLQISIYMKSSLNSLNQFTKELTQFLHELQDRANT